MLTHPLGSYWTPDFQKRLQVTRDCDPLRENEWLMEYFSLFFSLGNYHLLLRKLLSGGCWAGSEVPWLKSKLNSKKGIKWILLFPSFLSISPITYNLFSVMSLTLTWHSPPCYTKFIFFKFLSYLSSPFRWLPLSLCLFLPLRVYFSQIGLFLNGLLVVCL